MQTFYSDTHRAELSEDGILDVFLLKGKSIRETSFNGDQICIIEHTAKDGAPILRDLLNIMDSAPVLRLAFAKNNVFHVDYEAGTSRWKGYKTIDEIKDALNKCKFKIEDIDFILNDCSQTVHAFLPKIR